jgi:hypothetical protein
MVSVHRYRLALSSHPTTPSEAVRSLTGLVTLHRDGQLTLEYSLVADFSRLRIPRPRGGCRADELWKHTCFEAFVAMKSGGPYYELNFAPTGDWALYHFGAYREAQSSPEVRHAPHVAVKLFADRLELVAALVADELAALSCTTRLRLALAAVLEEEDGRLSYWAPRHAPGKPDFHHPDGFVLEIARRP